MKNVHDPVPAHGIRDDVSRDDRDRGYRRHVTWLALLDSGLLMIAVVFTPPLNPPQCPDYAIRMPDGSHCIIGANISAGLLWEAGILLVVAGAVGLVGSLVTGDLRPGGDPATRRRGD